MSIHEILLLLQMIATSANGIDWNYIDTSRNIGIHNYVNRFFLICCGTSKWLLKYFKDFGAEMLVIERLAIHKKKFFIKDFFSSFLVLSWFLKSLFGLSFFFQKFWNDSWIEFMAWNWVMFSWLLLYFWLRYFHVSKTPKIYRVIFRLLSIH